LRAKDLGRQEILPAKPLVPEATLRLHRGVYERMMRDYNKDLALASGKQDQYAPAFGGANFLEFLANDHIDRLCSVAFANGALAARFQAPVAVGF
jgi:galactokinase/mevalonate kinase-like predicted kinase